MKKKSKHTENMLFSCCFPMFMAHYIRFSINLSQVHVTVASQRLPSQIIHPFRNLFTTHFLYEAIPTAANVRTWIGDQRFLGRHQRKDQYHLITPWLCHLFSFSFSILFFSLLLQIAANGWNGCLNSSSTINKKQ